MEKKAINSIMGTYQNFQVVHLLRRRVRLQVPLLTKQDERTYAFEILLRKLPFIRRVHVVVAIGSVTIHFDPQQITLAKLFAQIDAIIPKLGSTTKPPTEALKNKHRVTSSPAVQTHLAVEGMTCASCSLLIALKLRRDPRILEADINYGSNVATIKGSITDQEATELIKALGYRAGPMDTLAQRRLIIEKEKQRLATSKRRAWMAGILTLPVMVIGMLMPRAWIWKLIEFLLTTPVVLWAGQPFFNKAYLLAKQRSANMDTLIALGAGSAYGYSALSLLRGNHYLYFEAASGIVFFVLLGRFLEEKAKGRASEAIRKLLNLQPNSATKICNGQAVTIHVDEIETEDILLVKPGSRIPTDGEVISGLSTVDESMVTGESMPVIKQTGDSVVGGCINGDGSFHMRATAIGQDTVLAGIIRMVDEAQAHKMPVEKMADQISRVFVPSVIGISLVTFLGWFLYQRCFTQALIHALSVLLIACPCAFGLATPTAIMTGTGRAARNGIFIRNGESLETAAKLTTLVFDKTGTITEGKPRVSALINISTFNDEFVTQLAASVENHSEHFLSSAIVAYAQQRKIPLHDVVGFTSKAGSGVRGQVNGQFVLIGNRAHLNAYNISSEPLDKPASRLAREGKTPVFVAIEKKAVALFGIADQPRSMAGDAITRLNDLGITSWMVTGDTEQTAQYIASQVGIKHVEANASPQKKLEILEYIRQKSGLVGMIGDGINDAPALAAADVGFAVGTGTDVAIEASHITLVSGDISKVADAIEISRRTIRIIRQNLFWALGYNTTAIPIAIAGRLNPMIASAAMAASSVSVVTNSLRLQNDQGAGFVDFKHASEHD
jgi:Cu+-exporting ATPase